MCIMGFNNIPTTKKLKEEQEKWLKQKQEIICKEEKAMELLKNINSGLDDFDAELNRLNSNLEKLKCSICKIKSGIINYF